MNARTKSGKISIPFLLIWASPTVATTVCSMLLAQITYFATDVLGLHPALVGGLLLASKIFDGITDIIAGFIIDKTNTKLGKGRPFDFAYLGFVIFTPILFSIPKGGVIGTSAALFITYFIIFSVFQTLYSCANTVYLARAVEGKSAQITVNTVGTMFASLAGIVCAIAIPQVIQSIGTDAAAWSKLAWTMAIPCAVLSVLRIPLIKEKNNSSVAISQKLDVKSGVKLLFQNKYVLLYAGALLATNIASNLSQGNLYYFQYVVGDIGAMSLFSIGGMAGPILMLLFPFLTRKIGLKNLSQIGLVCGAIGSIMPILAPTNITLLTISGAIRTIAYLPIFALAANAIIDCMDYGEWKSGKRGEGIYTCVIGFCSKVGIGIASWAIGMITALGGYDGLAETQTASALFSIKVIFIFLPAVMYVVASIFLHFYKLDNMMPKIKEDLENRRLKMEGEQ